MMKTKTIESQECTDCGFEMKTIDMLHRYCHRIYLFASSGEYDYLDIHRYMYGVCVRVGV